ncbi:MAG: carboxypeptidase-like regulatory domain-containing protein, partial [Gemmatimonadota bacterium]
MVAGVASAQTTGTVAGRVFDSATQQPIVGATVAVADRGGLTNTTGRFVITGVPEGTYTVRVQQIGYAESTQEVTVSGGETVTLEIAMTSEAIGLGERVVTSSYTTQVARDLTGVLERVSPDEFNTGLNISPEQLIQGKVAGVDVYDSGEPGGGIAVRIRGG